MFPLFAAATLGITLAASVADAAQRVPVTKTRAATIRSWTPAEIEAAKPLDRRATIPQRKPTPVTITPHRATPSFKVQGKPPSADVGDKLQKQLAPKRVVPPVSPRSSVNPNAASITTGALYSQTRVSPPELATTWPYRPAGKIFWRHADGRVFICSGSAVAPRILLTAAHCVFDQDTRTFASALIFVPAYVQGTAPAGVWTMTGGLVPQSYIDIPGVVHPEDFALLIMGDIAAEGQTFRLGDVVGWYGAATSDLATHLFHVDFLGYPANLDGGEIMQRTGATTQFTSEPNVAIYGSDQQGGSSGGPYVVDLQVTAAGGIDRYPTVVAAESFGDDQGLVGVSLFNGTFVAMFQAVCAAAPGNC